MVTFAALFMLATLVCRGVAGGGCFGGQPLALDGWIMMPSNTSDRLTSKPRQQRISSDEGNKLNDNEDKCNKGNNKKVEVTKIKITRMQVKR